MGARVTTAQAVVGLLICVGLLAARPFAAQESAAVSGTVKDQSGAVLPGVTVTIWGPRQTETKAVTDERGVFHVLGLQPGEYRVRVELSGFKTEETTVTVVSGRTTTIAVTLQVGSLAETVTVGAQELTIQTSTSARSFHSLPQSRSIGPSPFGYNREAYRHLPENGFHRVSAQPRSTFSTDVDTASYTNVRRMLAEGRLPPAGAVRIEEFINYFRFDYAPPAGDAPVAISTEVGPCPWNEDHLLALVGVRAADGRDRRRDGAAAGRNLVFLVDVSGSMSTPDKLPLVRQSLHLLTDRLSAADRIAIVVYAGRSGLALPSTSGDDKATIHAAIDRLESGGSTNGGEGIRLAYKMARAQFVAGGVNRVILATDGDFNVGVTSEDELVRLIEAERRSGVFLTVLGVGTGNLQDSTMEALADKGNGHYAYLDSLDEARKVLVREMDAHPRDGGQGRQAADRVQPAPGRRLPADWLREPAPRRRGLQRRRQGCRRDGGRPYGDGPLRDRARGRPRARPPRRPLKYQRTVVPADGRREGELMTVALRYKRPDGGRSERIEAVVQADFGAYGPNLGFASAVAELGLLLTRSEHAGAANVEQAIDRARSFAGEDPHEDRAGFVTFAERAAGLMRAARLDRR